MNGGYDDYGYSYRQGHPRPPTQFSTHLYGMNDMRNTGQTSQPTMQPQPPFYDGPPQYSPSMYQLPQGQPAFQLQMLPGPALYDGVHYMPYNQSMNGYGPPQHPSYYGQPPSPLFFPSPAPQPPTITESGRNPQGHNIADRTSRADKRGYARPVNYQDYLSGLLSPKAIKVCMVCFEESIQFAYSCTKCCTQICGDCIKGWFIVACKDESKMPPKCCGEISLASVSQYMSTAEAELYKAKYEEWSTPNKIYCPVPTCSTFITPKLYTTTAAPGFIYPNNFLAFSAQQTPQTAAVFTPTSATQPHVSCPKCDTSVCTSCRSMSHMGDCPKSDLDPKLEAQLNRWEVKRCPKCRAGVRKIAGCSHIKCRCGGEFCFSCLKPFRLCGGHCKYNQLITHSNLLVNGGIDGTERPTARATKTKF